MRLAVACAGRRGHRFLGRLIELVPGCPLLVFSFREEPGEPPFLDAIRERTLVHGGQFIETRKVDGPRALPAWEAGDVDLLLVVGWRYLIGPRAYGRPRQGTFVFHDSLLPRYRGFSPTVWAICNGESHTGVTLFRIADEVDTGDIVDQHPVSIGPDETIAAVMERVTQAYLTVLERNLGPLRAGTARLLPQDHSAATYVRKRGEADYQIPWASPAATIHNLVRAVSDPYPGAFTHVAGERLRVWAARALPGVLETAPPGSILGCSSGEGVVVRAGLGAVLLKEVQWQGGPVYWMVRRQAL